MKAEPAEDNSELYNSIKTKYGNQISDAYQITIKQDRYEKLSTLKEEIISKEAFPELIQSKCNKESISNALNSLKESNELANIFVELNSHLDGHGFDAAAKTIIDLK